MVISLRPAMALNKKMKILQQGVKTLLHSIARLTAHLIIKIPPWNKMIYSPDQTNLFKERLS